MQDTTPNSLTAQKSGHTKSESAIANSLPDSNAILHSFYDSAPMMMGVVDILDQDILHLSDNAATAQFMGITPGTTQNRLASDLGMPQQAIEEWLLHYRECAHTQSSVRFNYPHHTPQEVRWLSVTVSFITRSPEGHPRCSYIAEDITKQKRAADLLRQQSEALRESERRLRTLVDHFPNGAVVLFDREFRFTVAGGEGFTKAGMSTEVFEGKTVWEALEPDVAAMNHTLMRAALAGHTSTTEAEYADHIYELHVLPIRNEEHDVVAGMTLVQDITARKAAETRQRFLAKAADTLSSSLDYQTTLESVAQLLVPHMADWCVVHLLNEAGALEQVTAAHIDPARVEFAREFGRRYPPQMDAQRGLAAVLRSGKSEWIEHITEPMIHAVAQDEEHYRLLSASGMKSFLCVPLRTREKILGTISFISAESGHRYTAESIPLAEELARHAAIAVDNARLFQQAQKEIEERQRAEAALQESRDYYRTVIEAVPQLVWTTGPDGVPDYFNERWYAYTGQDPADVALKGQGAVHPEDRAHTAEQWNLAVQSGGTYEVEFRLRRADGAYRWFLVRAIPLKNPRGEILKWFGTCTDIDEQKRAEMEIAALNARLRRSVQETHHRVKNNLQIISALVELQVEENESVVPLTAMTRIGQHARSLAMLHDLLTHEAKAGMATDSITTRAALDKLIPLLQVTTGGRRIYCTVDDFRLPVRQGASLALLVSEMVSNAVKHGHDKIELLLTKNESTACLEVCDDGPGFPPDFDWRKAANTGLGLIDSTGRYDLHGTIVYANRPEGGARVTVTFPLP